MARPKKYGLDFFPFDVHFFADTKINRLNAKYGNNGVLVYIVLLAKIYEKGFYIEYNEDIILDISFVLGVKENFTRQVVRYLISGSLLDSTLAESCQILTSCAIQRRFQGAKRTPTSVESAYWLLKKEDTISLIQLRPDENNCYKNPSFCNKNSSKYDKNDTKKKRQDKTRLEERDTADKLPAPLTQSDAVFAAYKRICVSYPPIARISSSRVNAVEAMLDKGYSQSDFEELFKAAEKSSFLKGANPRGWKANFDWLVKESNAVKVLDGNYSDGEEKQEHSFDIDDYKKLVNSFGKE